MNRYLQRFGYYDIFLVDNNGNVVYSVYKELDFATSLTSGPWKQSGLAEAFNKAQNLAEGETYFTDLALYTPSYDAPAAFASTPIIKNDNNRSTRIGTLIFQMPLNKISEIMLQRSGLGETGETYLVGPDYLMRSDSYLDPKNHNVIDSFRHPESGMAKTATTELALSGKSGVQISQGFNNNAVLSAYSPINIGTHQWAIMAEKDVNEAFQSITELTNLLITIGIVGLLIILLASTWFSNRLARPIVEFTHKILTIAKESNFSTRIDVKS